MVGLFQNSFTGASTIYDGMRLASGSGSAAFFRNECERLWQQFEPYADDHFVTEFPRNTQERYWEMYLGTTLIEAGFSLERTPAEAPDLCTTYNGIRLWIECICPNRGEGQDRVPQQRPNEVYDVPLEQVLLRFSNAFLVKNEKLLEYRSKGIVRPDDITLVAISGAQLCMGRDADPPYAVRSTYGIGDRTVSFNNDSVHGPQIDHVGNSYRFNVIKKSGANITQTPFLDDNFSEISGAIFDMFGLGNYRGRCGSTLVTVPNMGARIELPVSLIPRGQEYQVRGDNLVRLDHEPEA